MSGFATITALKTALAQGRTQRTLYARASSITTVADVPQTFAYLVTTPNPAVLATPAAGLGGATVCNKDTVGAIAFNNATTGVKNWLLKFGIARSNSTILAGGTLLLVDRLAHIKIDINTATAAISPALDGTGRLAAGEGAMIIADCTTSFSAASNTITLGYTNQAGTSGRTATLVTTASRVAYGVAQAAGPIFLTLQSGDTGVRSIENWTLSSGTATGTIVLSLCKPLAMIGGGVVGDIMDRECLVALPKGVAIPDNACLVPYLINTGTSYSVMDMNIDMVMN